VSPLRILYITPWSPSLKTGGGRHCYANLRSLCSFPASRIDYIGPGLDHSLLGIERDRFINVTAREYTIFDKITAALNAASSSLIGLFKQFTRRHSLNEYDLIFIETTRCGFVFKELKSQVKTICDVHNVEDDYLRSNPRTSSRLAARKIVRSEEMTLKASDVVLVMHDADKQRLQKLYSINNTKRFILHPVCSFLPKLPSVPFDKRDKVIIFVGSLDQPFNENALTAFISRCWPDLDNSGYTLRIAGRSPSRNLVRLISNQKNIDLIANPPDMEPLMRKARLLILPDITGTGMKLRVAEALSYGVPVVGTQNGLRGYNNISQFGVVVEDIGHMTSVIRDLLENNGMKLSSLSSNAYTIWKEQYSFDVFSNRLHTIIREL